MSENSPSVGNPSCDVDDIEKLLEMRRSLLAELGSDEDDEQTIDTANGSAIISQSDFLSEGIDAINDFATNNNSNFLYERCDLHDEQMTTNNKNVEEQENLLIAEGGNKEQEVDNMDGFSSLSSSEEDEEIDESKCVEDIDELLEKAVEGKTNHPKNVPKRFKRVLEFRGTDHFDVLPDGWVEVTHSSGLPVYLHRPSRSCTFGRPYFLGPCSVRHHRVPESAIPCYYQKKLLAETEKQSHPENHEEGSDEGSKEQSQQDKDPESVVEGQPEDYKCPRRSEILDKLKAPVIEVKTAKDILDSQLTGDALYEYAKNKFRFRNICVYRFGKWSEARTFYKDKKRNACEQRAARKDTSRPGLPGNVQLITVPSFDHNSKPQQRGFYLNPHGKTSISILHEFVQKVLKCAVKYTETETRSCATPYHCIARLKINPAGNQQQQNRALTSATIRQKLMCLNEQYQLQAKIDEQSNEQTSATKAEDEEYITISEGYGNSKKLAKLSAAKKAVQSLIPGQIDFDDDGMAVAHPQQNDSSTTYPQSASTTTSSNNLEIFDHIKIGDTRVPELCTRVNQPTPYVILQECLKRLATFGDTKMSCESRRLRHQQHEFTMEVGKHTVKVKCNNKQEGKQKAAQKMIAKFHPNESTWGGILRLYGYEAQQKHKEARKSKESIIKLQGEVRSQNEHNGHSSLEANPVILEKLRSEMLKLSEKLVQKTISQPPSVSLESPKEPENGLEGPPKKKRKKRKAAFPDVQPDKCRPQNLGHTQPPILQEEQLRQMSAKLAEMHPQTLGVPIPCLEL